MDEQPNYQDIITKYLSSSSGYIISNDFLVQCSSFDNRRIHNVLRNKFSYGEVVVGIDRFRTARYPVVKLCEEAHRTLIMPNAGGNSIVSEVLSVEYMHMRFGAHNIVNEMEVHYLDPNWKKVDYLCTINHERVGVSVTRAMGYPTADYFTVDDASRLIQKKMNGLVIARDGVDDSHRFHTSFLHVFCQTAKIAVMMYEAMHRMPPDYDGVIVLLSITPEFDSVFNDDLSCFNLK